MFLLLLANILLVKSANLRKNVDKVLDNNINLNLNLNLDLEDEYFHWKEFQGFQEKFTKKYSSIEELETRFSIFRENLKAIMEHNADSSRNFTLGINQFTDLTSDEFRLQYIRGLEPLGSYGCGSFTGNGNGPVAVDWRNNGAVTQVKDQGQCGSCWTFSSTGAIEGAWAISKGQLYDLSEQQLVDCATGIAYGSYGCNGGQMEGAFKYVINNGQCNEGAYPYSSGTTMTSGTCKVCNPVVKLTSCSDVKPNDQLSLKSAVAKQPVSVAIQANSFYFQSYSSGVLTSTKCGTKLDHGVLTVGYGTENGIDYWLVKNSWGKAWGEQGYVKIAKTDSTNDPGICGIAMQPSFPIV